jgi:hypothetical protein
VGVYCLSLFKHWDCGFESRFGNGYTSAWLSEFGFCPTLQGDLPESREKVVSWLEWLVADLLSRRPGIDSRPAMLDVFEVRFSHSISRVCFAPFKILTGRPTFEKYCRNIMSSQGLPT